jgi:ribonuclease R
MLDKLKKRRAIEELSGGRYQLAGRKFDRPGPRQSADRGPSPPGGGPSPAARDEVKGRLVLHHDGYGFVVPDTPIPQLDGDLFIPRSNIEDAMHGDHVLAKIQKVGGFTGSRRAEGRIVRILSRAHPSVVGLFRYGGRNNIVLPYDTRIHHEIEIPSGDELTHALREKLNLPHSKEAWRGRRLPQLPELEGAVVNVELLRYARGGQAPVGRVIEILGRPGELGVDTEIIIRKHHLPQTFSAEVLRDAEHRAIPVSDADRHGREDFRHLPIVTIDGETARDFDDAVYVEHRPDGSWHLQVHIADVAHYVRTLTPLDQEARLRGTSVYFPDRAVPMLPEALSNGMCSLKPREDRLVMSALMEFDAAGHMRSSRMTSGVIRSAERMTYTNVNKVIEGDPEMSERYSKLAPYFRNMKELALLLNARRNEHGSIDFDLPEQVIAFDDQQRMIGITRSERNIAHRLIEEFMLAANRAVDGYLLKRGIESLHRVHEKPDAKKVLEFEDLARAFGYSLGVPDLHQREIAVRHGRVPAPAKSGRPDSYGHGRERGMKVVLPGSADVKIKPQHYQQLIRKVTGKPEERIISYLMLRSLKQARYHAEPLGHFALGFDEYTHFTSPIRRYPDLIVHRTLKWALVHPSASATQIREGAAQIHEGTAQVQEGTAFRHTGKSQDIVIPSEARNLLFARVEEKTDSPGGTLPRNDKDRTFSLALEARRSMAQSATPRDAEAVLYSHKHLEEMAAESSEAERRANGAERELMDWKTAQYMEQHLGEEYDALIISVQKFGCFVELFEVFVEGLLPINALEEAAGARCVYRERDHSIVALLSGDGRRGRGRGAKPQQLEWHLGDQVRVRAERIDPMRKRVEFALLTDS